MKNIVKTIIILSLSVIVSCRTEDIRTVEVFIPDMKSEESVRTVMTVLSQLHGVRHDTLTVNPDRSSVTVTYNSMKLALKNIEYAIAEAGFSTYTKLDNGEIRPGVPASAAAKAAQASPPQPEAAARKKEPAPSGSNRSLSPVGPLKSAVPASGKVEKPAKGPSG